MATIASLAPELLSEIFGQLSFERVDNKLYKVALVCRRWREPAQRILFQTVILRSERQGKAWLQSPARARYRTRSLEINSTGRTWDAAVRACPDLKALTVAVFDRDGNVGHQWCVGAGLDLSNIESLTIVYPEYFPTEPAALSLPNLRHLEVYVDVGDDEEPLKISTLEALFLPLHKSVVSLGLVGGEYLEGDATVARLAKVLAAEPFQHVLHLSLEQTSEEYWPDLLPSFPSLVTLELTGRSDYLAVEAIGLCVPPTIQRLVFVDFDTEDQDFNSFSRLLPVIKLPNLAGLRQLEFPRVSKDELAGETGLALLDECEKRSISLLCSYGYLTRDMMEEGASGTP